MSVISRRTVLATAALAPLAGAADAADGPAPVPGAPRSAFDKTSTAEEVTAEMDLSGKTVLITGCNSGLGLETARVLSKRGAHILGTARSKEKAAEAFASVADPSSEATFTPLACELTDFASVAACADAVKALGRPLDVLICNAGIMELPENEQVNGIEKHFVVNHLSHFVLVNRLIETVKAAPQGRIVMVGSRSYRNAPAGGIEFDNLSGVRAYEPNKMYGQSKMANHLVTRELARRLEGTTTTANTAHPGIINTNLGRHLPWYTRVTASLIGWTFMKTLPAGAATQCYVATAPALAATSGQFFQDCNPVVPERPEMQDADLAAKLWAVSEELTKPYLAGV